ncbi:hypothetical protein AURDEDRAFT_176523 [Auricularia subglabra TFB-10046 SS5]|uniref:F-box domain-containing protein n=1 Tax=Auricularia subglabra (strain TFB-10046 / SS5) TaxID=717982 RepID=J0CVI1_AURST|nr:hypothetical protein AURDEDRAFT_176523 [Auricularia subglabra TFB-10046 SS5]
MLELTFPPSPLRRPVVRHSRRDTALTLPELVKLILQWLPNLAQVARARYVSSTWWRAGSKILQRMHNLDLRLSPFIVDIPGLRRLMCEMDGVIGGTFAADFFHPLAGHCGPSTYRLPVLELFFEWTFEDEVGEQLEAEGYVLQNRFTSKTGPVGFPRGTFKKIHRFVRDGRHVDLVLTWENPLGCIFMSDSANTMNFITWDAAYCMFPDALIRGSAILWRLSSERLRGSLNVWAEVGLDAHQWVDSTVEPRRTRRWVGDAACWTVTLETDSVLYEDPVSKGPELVLRSTYYWEVNNFLVVYERAVGPAHTKFPNARLWRLTRVCVSLESMNLLYSYAVSDDFRQMYFNLISRRLLSDDDRVDEILERVRLDRVLLDG